jgi:hypothetical protein
MSRKAAECLGSKRTLPSDFHHQCTSGAILQARPAARCHLQCPKRPAAATGRGQFARRRGQAHPPDRTRRNGMARYSPPRKVTYFEPGPPRLARNTIIESTFEVGRRFSCTMRVDCGQLDPGAVIRPVPSEWRPRMPERLTKRSLRTGALASWGRCTICSKLHAKRLAAGTPPEHSVAAGSRCRDCRRSRCNRR